MAKRPSRTSAFVWDDPTGIKVVSAGAHRRKDVSDQMAPLVKSAQRAREQIEEILARHRL